MNNLTKNCDILNEFGGHEYNSLLKIIDNDTEEGEPQILQDSIYTDLDTIHTYIVENRGKFTIFSTNIECLNTKFNELVTLIKYLKDNHQFHFSVICLQECWLSNDEDVDDLEIPGYQILPQKYQCSKKGGFVTYVFK